jgi:hypothetical protein
MKLYTILPFRHENLIAPRRALLCLDAVPYIDNQADGGGRGIGFSFHMVSFLGGVGMPHLPGNRGPATASVAQKRGNGIQWNHYGFESGTN